jgi:hypothetical protein
VRFETTLHEARVHAVLRDFNMRADATIDTRAPYNAVVSIEAPSLDLERVLRGIEMRVPITGSARLSAHASGPLDEWQRGRASVTIAAVDARVGALAVRLAAPAEVAYENSVVQVHPIEMLAGDTRVSATGALPLKTSTKDTSPATTLLVTATGDLAQFTNAIAATGLIELPAVSAAGPAAFLARVTGSLEHPRVAADLELGPGTLRAGEMPPATAVQVRAHSDGEWIEVRELTAEWQGSRVQASGRIPVEWAGLAASPSDRRDGPSAPPVGTLSARLTSAAGPRTVSRGRHACPDRRLS